MSTHLARATSVRLFPNRPRKKSFSRSKGSLGKQQPSSDVHLELYSSRSSQLTAHSYCSVGCIDQDAAHLCTSHFGAECLLEFSPCSESDQNAGVADIAITLCLPTYYPTSQQSSLSVHPHTYLLSIDLAVSIIFSLDLPTCFSVSITYMQSNFTQLDFLGSTEK